MKRKCRQILSFMLSFIMVLGLMPALEVSAAPIRDEGDVGRNMYEGTNIIYQDWLTSGEEGKTYNYVGSPTDKSWPSEYWSSYVGSYKISEKEGDCNWNDSIGIVTTKNDKKNIGTYSDRTGGLGRRFNLSAQDQTRVNKGDIRVHARTLHLRNAYNTNSNWLYIIPNGDNERYDAGGDDARYENGPNDGGIELQLNKILPEETTYFELWTGGGTKDGGDEIRIQPLEIWLEDVLAPQFKSNGKFRFVQTGYNGTQWGTPPNGVLHPGDAIQFWANCDEPVHESDANKNISLKIGDNSYPVSIYYSSYFDSDGDYEVRVTVPNAGTSKGTSISSATFDLTLLDLGFKELRFNDDVSISGLTYRTTYGITTNLSNTTSTNTAATMEFDAGYSTTFKAATGYHLPDSITVTDSKGNNITAYSYNKDTGAFSITADNINSVRDSYTVTVESIPNTYTVILDDNGGSGGDGTVTATYDALMPSPVTTPTRTGYEFQGYWGSRMSGDVLYNDIQFYNADGTAGWDTYTLTEGSTFTAGWEANTITMYLNSNGGIGGAASFDVKYDAEALAAPFTLPTRTGYNLTGFWSGTGTGAVKVVNTDYTLVSNASGYTEGGKWKRAENGILYAQWTPLTPTVTLDKNSTYATNGNKTSVTATYDSAMPALTGTGNLPTRPGYTFDGYWTEKTGGTQYYNGKGESVKNADFTTAATLYAHWKANDYTITFNANGGKGSTSASVTYDAAYPGGIQPPTRSGHHFLGYYLGDEQYYNPGMQAQKTSYTIEGDIELTAKWQPLEYTINYYDGSIYLGEQDATYGTLHTIRTAEYFGISKDNYTLVGWADNPNLSTYNYAAGQDISHGLVTDPDVTFIDLYAIWKENDKFTVSYNTNGGMAEGLPVPSFEYSGTEITVTDVIPTSAGYDFKGWVSSVDGAVLQAGDTITVDNVNITLTAKWEKIPVYTLTYNANGGMGTPSAEDIRQNTSADVNFNSTPQKVGYTFLGYAESSDATEAAYTADGTKTITMDSDKTLYAVWKINTYSITYDTAAGFEIAVTNNVTTVEHGGGYSITVTVDDEHDGSAMTVAVNGAVQALADVQGKAYTYNISNVTENQHITVSGLTPAVYSVTLYLNGGQLDAVANVSSYTYGVGNALPTANDISRKGYTFLGWYENSDFSGEAVTEISATDSGDKVFYAKWTPNTYSIVFNGNGATAGTTESISNITYDTPTALTQNGYTLANSYFMGWSDNADATFPKYSNGETVKNLAESGTVTLYAVWSGDNKYYVTYNANGGSGGPADSNTYFVDEDVEAKEDVKPTREGYTFAGWATSPYSSDTVTSAKMVDGGLTFYAVWEKNSTYTVSYHPNGGEGSIPVDVTAYESGDAVTVSFMPLPKKLGYTFAGWAASANADTAAYTENSTKEFEIGTENVTLYAVWEPITYTIKYNGAGAPAQQTMTYDEAEALTAANSNPGHQFKGWAGSEVDAANGIVRYADGQEVKNLASTQDAVIDLYAVWTPAVTAIVFDFDGGSGGTGSASVNYGEALPAGLSAPTRYGYKFMGYYDGQVQYYDSAMESVMTGTWASEAESITLKAVWEGVDYTIKYVNGDTQLDETTSATYGTQFNLETAEALGLTAPSGKRFAGWSIWSGSESVAYTDGQQITTGLTNVDGDTVYLYAVWTDIETYKVTYNANGGQGVPSDSSAYQEGNEVNVLFNNNPAIVGYTFLGWSRSPEATDADYTADGTNSFNMPAEDVTLYAVWKANEYSVKYFEDETSASFETDDFTYGVSGELNNGSTLSKDGYTFAGWSLTSGGAVSYLGGQQIINLSVDNGAVINLYAVWTANEVEVTFNANGGSVAPESLGYTYGESYGILPTPSKEGYTFAGWFTANDEEVTATSIVTETQPHKLTAKWTANEYDITYIMNGGSWADGYAAPKKHTFGTATALPVAANISKTGAEFSGWYTDAALMNSVTELGAEEYTGAITLYAGWATDTYTVTLDNSGTGYTLSQDDADGEYAYGDTATITLTAETGFDVENAVVYANGKPVSKNAGGKYVFTVTEDVTVTVANVDNRYNVLYDANSGDGDAPTDDNTYKAGDVITLPANTFTKTGYDFVGWSTKADATNGVTGAYTIQASDIANGKITFYAIWKESGSVQYTVEYYLQNTTLDGYESNAEATVTAYGTTGADVNAEVKEFTGFTFDADNAENAASGKIAADGTLVLKLYYGRDVYDITLRTNDGTINEGDVTSYIYGVGATLPTEVTKTGFTFGGWFTDSSLEGNAVTEVSATDTGDKIFYAKWVSGTGVAYKVEHYKETLNGTYEMADADDKTGVTGESTLAAAKTYEGFTVREPITQETIKADGTTVAKIYYTRNSYTVTFKPENGERDYVYTLKYGAPITAPTVTKDGNSFGGWDSEVAQTMPAENLTYTATWSNNMFAVTLPTDAEQANEGYEITVLSTADDADSGKYAYGSEYSFMISPVGDTDISGMLVYVNNVAISAGADDVYRFTVEAYSVVTTRGATAGKHSVSYNPNGGKGVPYDAASYAAGETVTLIFDAYVTRSGYTFLGWDTDKDAVTPTYTQDASTLTMQESDVELYAIWLRNIGIGVTDSDGAQETVENGEYVITYDGEVHTLSLAADSGLERITYQWYKDGTAIDGANTASITVKNVADSGVYRCDVTYSQDGTIRSDSATITVTINRASLTAVATDKDVVYGEENPEFAYTLEGLLGEDTEAVITGEAQYTTDRLIDSDMGDYTITIDVSGLMTDNYTVTGRNGTLTVTLRTVTIAWPTTTRFAYSSGTERSFEATLGNIYGEDVVTAVMGGDWKKTEIGTYTATVTGLAGDDAGNYQLPEGTDASWEIYQRSSGGGGGGYVATYKVIVSEDIVNGEVTSSVKTARSGAAVTITVEADNGYELEALTVTDKNNKAVETTKKADGEYTFKMPASDVTVNAQFKEVKEDDTGHGSGWSDCPKDSTCPIYPFTDAEPTAWYHDGVHFCIDNEYMLGYPDGTFQPGTATSRAMIITMLWRMEGSPETEYEHGFTDVKTDDWYADAIAWGAENGIITGYGNGICAADDIVTREQMAAFFYRFAELKGVEIKSDDSISTSDYTDADAISGWAEPMMEWACDSGLIKGMDNNTLAPQGNTTRAQVATMFVRFCEFIIK